MLNFSFKLTKAVPTGAKLHFKVTKPVFGVAALNAKTLDSKTLEFVVGGPVLTISSQLDLAATSTLTLTSDDFAAAPSTMTFRLHSPSGTDLELKPFLDSSSTNKALVFKIPAASLDTAGCWEVQAFVGLQPVSITKQIFALVPPTVDAVALDATDAQKIQITGTDLGSVNCKGEGLSFTLVNATDASKTFTLDKPDAVDNKPPAPNSTSLTIPLPKLATAGVWTVKVVFDGKPLKDFNLTLP